MDLCSTGKHNPLSNWDLLFSTSRIYMACKPWFTQISFYRPEQAMKFHTRVYKQNLIIIFADVGMQMHISCITDIIGTSLSNHTTYSRFFLNCSTWNIYVVKSWNPWSGTTFSQLSSWTYEWRQQRNKDKLLSVFVIVFSAFIFCTVSYHCCTFSIERLCGKRLILRGEQTSLHKYCRLVPEYFTPESAETCHGLMQSRYLENKSWFPFKHATWWLLFCSGVSIFIFVKT